jgi:hypothetical protein
MVFRLFFQSISYRKSQYAKNIWISLASYRQISLNLKLDMDPFVCKFNCYSGDLPQCVNICSLLAKKYVYACKIKNSLPTVEGYHTMLKKYKNVDLASCYLSIFSIASLQKVHNAVSDSLHFIKRWFVKIIL